MGFRGRHANKRDANEADLVAEFRAHGCSVAYIDVPCDLIVGYRGRSHLVEVKQEGAFLNTKQSAFKSAWRGDFYIVRSVSDVAEVLAGWHIETKEV